MMTRVAALYDIHGNLPALEAVLDDVRREGVELIVAGGDVLPGPMPQETLACLLGAGIPLRAIQGNGDREGLALASGATSTLPAAFQLIVKWSGDQLGPIDAQVIRGWPKTVQLEVHGLGVVMFCHATPRNDTEIFTRLTPEANLRPVFAGVDASVVVCGHTHMQFDRMIGMTRVVNAGSVGMPFGATGAHWLLLGPDIQLRRTSYDLEQAASRIRATRYPGAEEFATNNVLTAPNEQETLSRMTAAEIRLSP
jgi:putative phosphoesterase